jgi:cell division protein FtsL
MASLAAARPQRMSEAWGAKLGAALKAMVSAALSAAHQATRNTAWQSAVPAAPRRYMPGAPEIYFRKAIDNSRLVRAVDPMVKREMRLFTATVVICFLMALGYLGQHCSSIEYGYKIEDLRARRDQLAEVNRTLKLEEATLKDPERINALANNMGLALPAVGQVQRMDEVDARDSGAPVMARADSISVISVPN